VRRTTSRRTRLTALVAGLAATVAAPLLTAPAAQAEVLPRPPANLPADVDAFAAYQGPTSCQAPQPGTLALRQLLLDTYGRQTIGSARACPANGVPVSEHSEGRALDWMLSAADPAQKATADAFLAWLLAPDAAGNAAANARRLGVMYVIFNAQVWKAYRPGAGWQPYTGAEDHTDHIHLSLTPAGAARETSWWTGTADPLEGHWIRLGGERSVLGGPVSGPRTLAGGSRCRSYRNGSVCGSPTVPAREVHGAISGAFNVAGGPGGLGLPLTDELATPGRTGAYNHFQGGSVYWSPATGAHVVRGGIRERWASLGWERGLGFPTTDDAPTPGRTGYYTHFQGGSVYFSPATGSHAVRGAIRDRWAALGWEKGWLGYPAGEEHAVPGGLQLDFQGGWITYDTARRTATATRR